MNEHDHRRNNRCHLASGVWVALAAAIVVGALWWAAADGEGIPIRPPIRVACFDVSESGDKGAPRSLQRCFASSPDFTLQSVTVDDILGGVLSQIDVLICPGGSGSKEAKSLGSDGARAIREFVQNGGGYLGFCAGSYLATCQYTWSLGILNANVVDREHWARGLGNVTLQTTPVGKRVLGTMDDTVTCYYGQGPLLAPGTSADLPPYVTLATFSSEMTKNGAPSGVMIGTTAIAAATFGKGRVLCFSPHPELTSGLGGFVRHAARWAAGRD